MNWPEINFTDPAPPKKTRNLRTFDPDLDEEMEPAVLEPALSSSTSTSKFYGKALRKGVARLEDEGEAAQGRASKMRLLQRDGKREDSSGGRTPQETKVSGRGGQAAFFQIKSSSSQVAVLNLVKSSPKSSPKSSCRVKIFSSQVAGQRSQWVQNFCTN